MIIRTNAKDNRKELINTLSEVLHEKPRYRGAPSFAYEFSLCRVDREASIHLAPTIVRHSAENAAALLNQRGFGAEVVEEAPESTPPAGQPAESRPSEEYYTVRISSDKINTETLARLEALVAGKASLLRKALRTENLSIVRTPSGCAFPWFQLESTEEERRAYSELVRRLVAFASCITRATAKDKPTDNEKYAFRCWLLRLGFIGAQYKRHRSILMRNLNGHAAFKCGYDPRSHKDANKQRLNRPA